MMLFLQSASGRRKGLGREPGVGHRLGSDRAREGKCRISPSLSWKLRASGLGGASHRPRDVHSRGLERAWPRAPPPSAGSKCAASAEAGSERSGGSHRGSRRPPGSGPTGHSGTGVLEGVPGLHPTGSHGPLRRWGGRGRSRSVPDSLGWLRPQPPPPPSCGEVRLIGACATVCGGDAAKRGARAGDEGKQSHVGKKASCVGGTTFSGFQKGSSLWPCVRAPVALYRASTPFSFSSYRAQGSHPDHQQPRPVPKWLGPAPESSFPTPPPHIPSP